MEKTIDQSQVSKLSEPWREATNVKRANRSGFGGISGLEKKRQYRDADGDSRSRRYGMVFDKQEIRERRGAVGDRPFGNSHQRDDRNSSRSRSRSPYRRDRSPRIDHKDWRDRSRERDPRYRKDRAQIRDEYR